MFWFFFHSLERTKNFIANTRVEQPECNFFFFFTEQKGVKKQSSFGVMRGKNCKNKNVCECVKRDAKILLQ